MSLNVKLLSENLQEIFSAAHRPAGTQLSIVASLFKNKIYDAHSGWGRLWRWIYNIISFCKCNHSNSFAERRLKAALMKTNELFQEQLPIIQAFTEQYSNYVREHCRSTRINENDFTLARHAITQWNEEIADFVNLLHNQADPRLRNLLTKYLTPGLDLPQSPFTINENLKQALYHCQQLINYEGQFQRPLPLDLFWKLAWYKKTSQDEILSIEKWSIEHQKMTPEFGLDQFHNVFKAAVTLSAETHAAVTPKQLELAVARLEFELLHHKFTPLAQADPVHLAWRDSLEPGSKISWRAGSLTLGDEIQSKESEKKELNEAIFRDKGAVTLDKNRVFNIIGQPDFVLVSNVNRAIPGMRELAQQMQREAEQKGGSGEIICQSADYLYVDPEGQFAIIEKIDNRLSQIKWKTKENEESEKKFHSEDLVICDQIAQIIASCLSRRVTPYHLNTHHMGFSKNEIKFHRYTEDKNTIDFNQIETFISDLAPPHHPIYHYLMKKSGLFNQPQARFYNEIIKMAALAPFMPDDKIEDELRILKASSDIQIHDAEFVKTYKKIQQIREREAQRLLAKGKLNAIQVQETLTNTIKDIFRENRDTPWKVLMLRIEHALIGIREVEPAPIAKKHKKSSSGFFDKILSAF